MSSQLMTRAVLLATTVSMAATTLPVSAASAQDYGPPPNQQGYDQPPPGYGDQPPPGYDNQQPPPPPPGYNGEQPPPPPPGYDAGGPPPEQQAQDQRYSQYAEQWAQEYCVRSHGNVGAGVLIGSLFGAIIGSGLGGRHDRGGGAFAGAAVGGLAGGAIAASAGSETSPGCPPGEVVRREAPPFEFDAAYGYAAPYWYRPWIWGGDGWVFRPYPYHAWYYHHYYGRGGRRHYR